MVTLDLFISSLSPLSPGYFALPTFFFFSIHKIAWPATWKQRVARRKEEEEIGKKGVAEGGGN